MSEEEKSLTAKQEVICSLSATGLSQSKIAERLGCSAATVSNLLAREDVQEHVKKLRNEIFSWEPKRVYRSVFPKAFETAEKIMEDENVRAAVRLNAAQDFMDRATGKATQNVEVGGSLIRDLLDAIKKDDEPKDIVDVEYKEIGDPDEIDKFLED